MKYRVPPKLIIRRLKYTFSIGKASEGKVQGHGRHEKYLASPPWWLVPSQSVAVYCLEYVLKLAVQQAICRLLQTQLTGPGKRKSCQNANNLLN